MMQQWSGWQRLRLLLVATFSASLLACQDEVPLGAWELPRTSDGGGGTSAGSGGGPGQGGAPDTGATLPECLEPGSSGPLNPAGQLFGATETATDWTWPSPVRSMQWDLMVEREIENASSTGTPTSGYYWTHQFSFLEGIAGFFGIQAEGVYQVDPPDSPVELTKIAVFWLSGPPIDAELGDIAYPDARVAPTTAAGVSYLTIHARFDWQSCRVYRFRIGPDGTEADGSVWYGAWIDDTASGDVTFLGRMRLPADSGPLAPFSVSRSLGFEFGELTSCDAPAHASALFGRPRAGEGDVAPLHGANRFSEPLRCPSSRFTEFDSAVRHELGVPP